MAKWRCTCGNTIRSSGGIPNPQEWHLIADTRPALDQDVMTFGDLLAQSVYVYLCEQCARLHVLWEGFEGDTTVYAPERG